MRYRLAGTLLACAIALAAPAGAGASEYVVSVMQDDNQLVYGTGAQREFALDGMQGLGVDAVRVTVLWEVVAPARKPRDTTNPRRYGAARWDRYDELVKSATRRGMAVYFDVTAPGPRWAHERTSDRANRRTWIPKAREWYRFIRALGKRYSGAYRDENAGRETLPRVAWWGLFNEPNQGGWLTPQAIKTKKGRILPVSPIIYRSLMIEGARGLISTGHADDLIVLGETAPLGVAPQGARRPLRPALFIRETFCLDDRLRPFRGEAARLRGCDKVKRLSVLSKLSRLTWGHHPYTKNLSPTTRHPHRDSISMASIRRLPALLDKIAKRTGLLPEGMPILLTEFGYETDPPDPFNGVSEKDQAEYLNLGDYIAFKNPRVFANTQFQLFDVPPQTQFPRNSRQYWFTFQSGLFRVDGSAKPSAHAYMMPFEVRPAGGNRHLFWGQVRFTPNGAKQTVYLQAKAPGGDWQNVGEPVNVENHLGFWEVTRESFPGVTWRAAWVSADGADLKLSREITTR